MKTLIDQHGRVIRDLRISVTPRCNFRCSYCDPLGMGHKDPLGTVSVKDVSRVIDAAVSLGLTSVRFTGGEPLLRKELPEMIAYAKDAGVEDIAITTNATLLKRRLPELLAAGLHRVNISLDAVDEGVFKRATGGGSREQQTGVGQYLRTALIRTTPCKDQRGGDARRQRFGSHPARRLD